MTLQIFGQRFDAPAFDDATIVRTPVGSLCLMCGERIEVGDNGVMMQTWGPRGVRQEPEHLECHLRSVLGSIEHLEGQCTCFSDAHRRDDESYRETARLTMKWIRERRRDETAWDSLST